MGRQWEIPAERSFRVLENEWIPLKDGVRIASRQWIPDGADSSPVPVVLEYIPYRKRDLTRARDDRTGHYLASHGIAFARVDLRGTGESDGVLQGEYTRQEHADALEVIDWLASQPWSNGSVGMRGISWGGFTTVQVAALAPPALKAIMPACFTDNQFTDDAHYLGGGLCSSNFYWGTMFQTVMTGPPDPAIVGDKWKSMWLERLEAAPPILSHWTSHQRYDDHWKGGSIATDYSRIKCPVYAVGGLADHFVNVNARLMTHLKVPRKCIIGPWAHNFPDDGDPGPGLDWAHEEVRWWEHWLRGVETGIMDEPMFRVYLRERTPVEVYPHDTPGRWVAEDVWPSKRITPTVLYLDRNGLTTDPGVPVVRDYVASRIVGLKHGEIDGFFFPMDFPQEQTTEDAKSLTFDSAPLNEPLDIVGQPVLRVHISTDVTIAMLAVRLNEVTEDGQSWQLSSGFLNLTHRDSDERPALLEPGRSYEVEVQLAFTSQRLRRGSKIRVAISESCWPLIWPSPRMATLSIKTAVSALTLPVRPPKNPEDIFRIPLHSDTGTDRNAPIPAGDLAVFDEGSDIRGLMTRSKTWSLPGSVVPTVGTKITAGWTPTKMSIVAGDPTSARWAGGFRFHAERVGWSVAVEGRFELHSSLDTFYLTESIEAYEGSERVFERFWTHEIPRDHL